MAAQSSGRYSKKKTTQQDSLDPDFIKNVKVNKPASIARQIAVFAVKRRIHSIIILQRDSDEYRE